MYRSTYNIPRRCTCLMILLWVSAGAWSCDSGERNASREQSDELAAGDVEVNQPVAGSSTASSSTAGSSTAGSPTAGSSLAGRDEPEGGVIEPEQPEQPEVDSGLTAGTTGDGNTGANTGANREANTFVELSERISGNPVHRRYGIAITDFDLDGDFEVVVTGYGAPNEVYDYQGDRWVDVAPETLQDSERRAIGVAACDMDADGAEELYFLNVDRFGGLGEVSDRLFMRDSTSGSASGSASGWIDLFEREENRGVINQFSGRSVACLDRLGAGKYGVFVANYGGPMKLFELSGEATLSDVGPEVGINLTTGGRGLLSLPRPEPGMHLFAGNEGGANYLFLNRGGVFDEVAARVGVSDARETVRGVATLDVNEDGLFDLVYGNWEGPHRLFVAQDTGAGGLVRYEDRATPEMSAPSRIRTVIAADFDNDGYEELFFNNIGEPNRLFRRDGEAWVSVELEAALEPDGLGTGAAVVDSDQDGILELWVAHGESGAQPLSLYQWGDQGHHWLRIAPITASGAPARGARVTLYQPDGRVQRRVIDAGSGYLCQMEPVAHFGLGEVNEVERVVIEWVSGARYEINQPAIDRALIVSADGVIE